MTRLLVDTSVLLSAVVGRWRSPPARLLTGLREGAGELVICPAILREVRAGLAKPYFARRVTEAEAREIVTAIQTLADVHPDPDDPPKVLRDPTDDFLVAVARASDAVAIVTSDHDLLDHPQLRPPAIDAHAACQLLGI